MKPTTIITIISMIIFFIAIFLLSSKQNKRQFHTDDAEVPKPKTTKENYSIQPGKIAQLLPKLIKVNDLMIKLYDQGLIDRLRIGKHMIYKKYVDKFINENEIFKILGKTHFRKIKGNYTGYFYLPQQGWIDVKASDLKDYVNMGFTYIWECSDGTIYLYCDIYPKMKSIYNSSDGFYLNYICIITK